MAGEVAQNCTGFRWNPTRDRAAELVADDHLTDEAIAAQLRVSRRTLAYWKRHPAFAARVAERRAAQRAAIEAEGITNKQNRVAILQDRHDRIQRLIEARAADMADGVPGGDTGLLVREAKVVKVYEVKAAAPAVDEDGAPGPEGTPVVIPQKRVELVYEYTVDTALLREDRATLEQAAKELGQLTDKQEITGKDGAPLVDLATLMQRARAARARREAGADGRGDAD